jgi:hypothetical protein
MFDRPKPPILAIYGRTQAIPFKKRQGVCIAPAQRPPAAQGLVPELMVAFNHSTQRQTLDYLCVQPDEILSTYENEL